MKFKTSKGVKGQSTSAREGQSSSQLIVLQSFHSKFSGGLAYVGLGTVLAESKSQSEVLDMKPIR